MHCVLQSYCERPHHPSAPAPSHRAGSAGGVRHSCSTAELAAGSPAAAGRRPRSDPPPGTLLHPPSCSEETPLWRVFTGAEIFRWSNYQRDLSVPLQWSGAYMVVNERRDHTGSWMRVPDSWPQPPNGIMVWSVITDTDRPQPFKSVVFFVS